MESNDAGFEVVMDPNFISSSNWSQISEMVGFLWRLPLFAIGFGFSLLLARAIIPSLLATRQVPERIGRLAPVLTAFSFICFGLLLWTLYSLVDSSGVLEKVYSRWWI